MKDIEPSALATVTGAFSYLEAGAWGATFAAIGGIAAWGNARMRALRHADVIPTAILYGLAAAGGDSLWQAGRKR